MKILDQVKIVLNNTLTKDKLSVYIDVYDNSLSRKWLTSLNHLLLNNYHLEKNYCFFGFVNGDRNGKHILNCINQSIESINQSNLGYVIDDYFSMENCLTDEPVGNRVVGRNIIHEKFNRLHRYFEDLQGTSGNMSMYYTQADARVRWHIRQLNLLCHEFESWALSYRKQLEAPAWQRPSQLMCWLNAPRFELDYEDYELFGIDTISRGMGGVYLGVNKAVGKHHWEVYHDEGRDSRINELTTTTLRSQTEAAGDFDIDWGRDPTGQLWQIKELNDFKQWLVDNNFDPNNKALTIGHPKIGQVDLIRSFNTEDLNQIWQALNTYLDVYQVETSTTQAIYDYHWSDPDFIDRQISIIEQGN